MSWVGEFDNDKLTPEMLNSMIEKGAEYLFTDSNVILNRSNIVTFLDKLILERGTIKIYSLKKFSP